MKKWLKILVWTLITFIVIAVGACFFLIYFIGAAFGSNCVINNEWEIERYTVIEQQCIGWAGPHYYPAYLYKDDQLIGKKSYRKDSCCFEFTLKEGDKLQFNVCDKSLERGQK